MSAVNRESALGFCKRARVRLEQVVSHDQIRLSTLYAIPYWIGAAITALVAVAYAEVFVILEGIAGRVFEASPYWFFLLAPIAFFLSWYLVHRFAPEAGGSGIPQLMVAAEEANNQHSPLVERLLSVRSMVVKILSSSVALLGGGAIGREGPTLQIAGAIFYQVGRRLPKYWPRPNLQFLTLSGGAAGLAAAFNTPLGGIVYAVEELAKIHLSSFRTPILHAVLVSGLVAQLILGPYLYLGYPQLAPWNASQLPPALFVGFLVGILGALHGRILLVAFHARRRLPSVRAKALAAIGCGVGFALVVYFCGIYSIGSGKELMNHLLFVDASGRWYWPLARIAANILTFSAGGAGGIFAPALASGAAVGSKLALLFPDTNTNLVILLCMIAFLTGVTHTPLTAFVLVLEMSDRHSAIFPMMVAALSAYAGALLVDRESFYEHVRQTFEKDAETKHQDVLAPEASA